MTIAALFLKTRFRSTPVRQKPLLLSFYFPSSQHQMPCGSCNTAISSQTYCTSNLEHLLSPGLLHEHLCYWAPDVATYNELLLSSRLLIHTPLLSSGLEHRQYLRHLLRRGATTWRRS